jgi:hypothetical protein
LGQICLCIVPGIFSLVRGFWRASLGQEQKWVWSVPSWFYFVLETFNMHSHQRCRSCKPLNGQEVVAHLHQHDPSPRKVGTLHSLLFPLVIPLRKTVE